jgi:arabinose-5-phosphate isomerase
LVENEIKQFLDILGQELNSYFKRVDMDALERAKELILTAQEKKKRVHVTGIGKPGHVSAYIASLLSSTGTPAYELHGTEAVHGSSGQVLPGDVVIAISNSGETAELIATVETLKRNGAAIIAVTGKESSWLATHGDVFLFAGVSQEGDSMNKPPRISILAEMIVLQCLSLVLQNHYQLTPEQYVKWHPGGALGKSMLER